MSAIILENPTSTLHLPLANTQFSASLRINPVLFFGSFQKPTPIRLLSTPSQRNSSCFGYIYKLTQSCSLPTLFISAFPSLLLLPFYLPKLLSVSGPQTTSFLYTHFLYDLIQSHSFKCHQEGNNFQNYTPSSNLSSELQIHISAAWFTSECRYLIAFQTLWGPKQNT